MIHPMQESFNHTRLTIRNDFAIQRVDSQSPNEEDQRFSPHAGLFGRHNVCAVSMATVKAMDANLSFHLEKPSYWAK